MTGLSFSLGNFMVIKVVWGTDMVIKPQTKQDKHTEHSQLCGPVGKFVLITSASSALSPKKTHSSVASSLFKNISPFTFRLNKLGTFKQWAVTQPYRDRMIDVNILTRHGSMFWVEGKTMKNTLQTSLWSSKHFMIFSVSRLFSTDGTKNT